MPVRARWIMACDCGWSCRVRQFDGTRPRSRQEIEEELQAEFVNHIPPAERQTYLLLDTRPQPSADSIIDEDGQIAIVGNFVMPEGLPVELISTRRRSGVHFGRFRIGSGDEQELPIGEVRTPDGRVFRLDE